MLRYRALLVDTERSYERPTQTFCNDPTMIDEWAKAVLLHAGKHAYVQIYAVEERESGRITRNDLYDQGAAAGVQPAGEKAG